VSVRSRGVDAPEIFRPACDKERELGLAAKASVARKFGPGRWVVLRDLENDKYGGRIVAQIDRWDSDRFKSLSEELLEKQGEQAVPLVDGQDYNWCEG
jgi:endonuclease YncB( thermonuclease family)